MNKKFLAEKHLQSKRLHACRLRGFIPKVPLYEIDPPMPADEEDVVAQIELLYRLSYHAYNQLPEVNKLLEQSPNDPELKFRLKTFRRNNYQANIVKDMYLNQAAKTGLASIEGVYLHKERKYVVFKVRDRLHVSLASNLGLDHLENYCEQPEQYPLALLPEINAEFADPFNFGYAIGLVRKRYGRIMQRHKHLNGRIAQHNRVYPQIHQKISAGEIMVIGDSEEQCPSVKETKDASPAEI